jgi:hypothetical protein
MSILTESAFFYGHNITVQNQNIDFIEASSPATTLTAEIEPRDYTLTEFIDAVALAMNNVGTQTYTVALDRNTRFLTISATNNFSLLPQSGPTSAISAFDLMGFTSDTSGSNSYQSDSPSGQSYEPQTLLQNFVDFEDDVRANESRVNTAADGKTVEAVQFGQIKRMTCNIAYITDENYGFLKRVSSNGKQEARNFLSYISNKYKIEFVPDKNNPGIFNKCLLDRSNVPDGTGYKLYEYYSRNILGLFQTRDLVFLSLD